MKPTHCEACGTEGPVGALSGLCAVCEDDVALHTAALELVRFKVTRDGFQQAFGAKKKTEDKAA